MFLSGVFWAVVRSKCAQGHANDVFGLGRVSSSAADMDVRSDPQDARTSFTFDNGGGPWCLERAPLERQPTGEGSSTTAAFPSTSTLAPSLRCSTSALRKPFVELRPSLADSGTSLNNSGCMSADPGPTLAEVGRNRAKFGRSRATLSRVRERKLIHPGPNWIEIVSAKHGARIKPTLEVPAPHWPRLAERANMLETLAQVQPTLDPISAEIGSGLSNLVRRRLDLAQLGQTPASWEPRPPKSRQGVNLPWFPLLRKGRDVRRHKCPQSGTLGSSGPKTRAVHHLSKVGADEERRDHCFNDRRA